MRKQSLGAGIFTTLMVMCLFSIGKSFTAKNPWPFIGIGALALAGAHKVYQDKDLVDFDHIDSDLYEFFSVLANEGVESLSKGWQSSAKSKEVKAIREVVMQNVPPSIAGMIRDKYMSRLDWIDTYLRGHHLWIVGKSGSGKTHLALKAIELIFEADPRTEMRICDRNFGAPIPGKKGEKPKEGNDWLRAPLSCIAQSEEHILEAVRWAANELKGREKECMEIAMHNRQGIGLKREYPDYPMILLVIDEYDRTQAPINRRHQENGEGELTSLVEYISKVGRKYRVKLLIIGQSLQVNATAIPQAVRQQFAICMLGANVFSPNEVKEFLKGDTEQLIADARQVDKSGIGFGPCIVALSPEENPSNDYPVARPVPEIAITFRFAEVKSADGKWWDVMWEKHEKEVIRLMTAWKKGEINSPKSEIVQLFKVKQSASDVRYESFLKPMLERIEMNLNDASQPSIEHQQNQTINQ